MKDFYEKYETTEDFFPGISSTVYNDRSSMTKGESLASFYKNEFNRQFIYTPGTLLDVHHAKRKSNRTRANGIVVLTSLRKPVVTTIFDIAPGGVSFFYPEEMDLTESALKMDILIFDILTNFEYLINQITGRVKSKKLVAEPKSKAPIWRYSVEFVDLDSKKQNRLNILFSQARNDLPLTREWKLPNTHDTVDTFDCRN